MNLNTPISSLGGVGKKTASLLERLHIKNVEDLLYYFPFRYEDYRRIVPSTDLQIGDQVTVKGVVELIANKRSFKTRRIITECLVRDNYGTIRVVWFNQPFLIKTIHPGDSIYLSGKVTKDMLGPQLVSPVFEKDTKGETTHTARLVPMYPLTAGLTEKQIRFLLSQIIGLTEVLPDWLPSVVREKNDLLPLGEALRAIHFPKDETFLKKSTDRLKFDELFLVQLQAELTRLQKAVTVAPQIIFQEESIKKFVQNLGFSLTTSQKKAAWEILQDCGKNTPMNRLLSGDVGSGKTIVAAIALFNSVLNGFQGVVMVPTEILARQHFESLCKIFQPYHLTIGLYTRSQRMRSDHSNAADDNLSKKEILQAISEKKMDIIIGTQSLLSEGVEFNNLGLVIVDEQHRFGVEQRRVIKEKGQGIHFLSMTATPIPRSFALMIYGDLDVSIINELPPGRKKILTRLVAPSKRTEAYRFIKQQVAQGRQVFVVCPLIEEQNVLGDKKSVLKEYKKLATEIFPDLRVGYLHGKMPAQGGSALGGKPSKESVMEAFKNGEIDILVSTSVIEVGVNIPNASVMMIEGADRFGLAQLHQFRGRVGRSIHQSYCLLFTDSTSVKVEERLKFFETCNDGFKLAEKDLEIRGPGEVYGTDQSGMMHLRLAKLTDSAIIKKAREVARAIAPEVQNFPVIIRRIKKWQEAVHLE
jgi:ATP-dependent DNA helicase RecG